MSSPKPEVASSQPFSVKLHTARGTGIDLYLVKFRGGVRAYVRTWEDGGTVLKLAAPEAALEPEDLEALSQGAFAMALALRRERADLVPVVPAKVVHPKGSTRPPVLTQVKTPEVDSDR